MAIIKIDSTGNETFWLYGKNEEWKMYVAEDFDENIILEGNNSLREITEASWYKRVWEILNDYDSYEEFPDDLTEGQATEIKRLYDECYHTEEIFMDVLKVLYPNEVFKTGTIRGYSQGDWQEYIVKEDVDINALENFYFGKVSDIYVEMENGENFCTVITDDKLWELEANGNLKEYLREMCELSYDEPITILQSDGYIQVPNWKEIC